MPKSRKTPLFFGQLAALAVVGLLWVATPARTEEKPAPVPTPPKKEGASEKKRRGRAQIWSQHCNRCHNMRSPDSYSDDQWETVVNHMRVRGGLTAKDAKKIEEFLKAGN